ncbi:heat shock protein 67B1 [Esox lucius]|uniref:SHSP domain-containing protein n=1 Tax=Esox lucius TaxID=8010 RepID=A0A3P8XKX2_ESOLU|nr:heat shock protein 67B1 [Esox lucius]
MTEQTKEFNGAPSAPGAPFRPHYSRDTFWSPLRNWGQNPSPSRLLPNQEFGMPPFLEVRDLREICWIDKIYRHLAASSWPGYIPSLPILMPSDVASASSVQQSGPRLSRAESAGLQGVSEVRMDGYKWRISLDVSHFSPTEITLRTLGGFLEIKGKHEERPDEQGFITRCFTRKYTLPIGIDLQTIRSSLYGDGILTVEASLPDPSIPANVNISIQVEKETFKLEGEEGGAMAEETTETEDTTEEDSETFDPQPSAPAAAVAPVPLEAPDLPSTEPGMQPPEEAPEPTNEVPRRVPGEEAHPESHPDTSAAISYSQEKLQEEMDKRTPTEQDGGTESHPSLSGDDAREVEGLPSPTETFEHLETSESTDTVPSDQGEHEEQAHDLSRELQHIGGTGEVEDLPLLPQEAQPGISAPEGGAQTKELEVPEQTDVEQQEHVK